MKKFAIIATSVFMAFSLNVGALAATNTNTTGTTSTTGTTVKKATTTKKATTKKAVTKKRIK